MANAGRLPSLRIKICVHLQNKALCIVSDFPPENWDYSLLPTGLGLVQTRRQTRQVLRLCRRKEEKQLGLVNVAFHWGTWKYLSANDD